MKGRVLLPTALAALLLLRSADAALALTFTVDRTDDSADPSAQVCSTLANDCSLRGAIIKANVDAAADTIILGAATYCPAPEVR